MKIGLINLLAFLSMATAQAECRKYNYSCRLIGIDGEDPWDGKIMQMMVTDDLIWFYDEEGIARTAYMDRTWKGNDLFAKSYSGLGHERGEHIRVPKKITKGKDDRVTLVTGHNMPYSVDLDCKRYPEDKPFPEFKSAAPSRKEATTNPAASKTKP